jgi:hippurate hydrolase
VDLSRILDQLITKGSKMQNFIAVMIFALVSSIAYAAHAGTSSPDTDTEITYLTGFYKELHQNPELSFQETETAKRLARELRGLGFDVTTEVGKTGVVGVLRNGDGPTLMIRADMDALPMKEETGLPYASTTMARTPGGDIVPVMHACGHDIHMTSWVGTARRLVGARDQWSGTLIMIAQPAEEIGAGAKAMIEDGLYERFPRPTHVLALHSSWLLPAGTIGYTAGYTLANVDSVDVLVRGIGGHGSTPHVTKDPVVLAANIVTALQGLVSREKDAQSPGVVTVGSIHGGTKRNIIPDSVKLELTIRSYDSQTRALLLDGIRRIAKGEALAAGIPDDLLPIVTSEETFVPATFNTEEFSEQVAEVFRARFGEENVVRETPVMGGEDFSHYYRENQSAESMFFWLGTVNRKTWDSVNGDLKQLPSVHSTKYAPDPEPTLKTGVDAMTAAAMHVLAP